MKSPEVIIASQRARAPVASVTVTGEGSLRVRQTTSLSALRSSCFWIEVSAIGIAQRFIVATAFGELTSERHSDTRKEASA